LREMRGCHKHAHVIYLGAAEQTSHGAWFLQALLNVEREKEVATEK
jgi:G:T-mismatch repair DNA endonuclease (very short patch repair protein)